jgi:DNA-binding CsgD family transcriptional regulator
VHQAPQCVVTKARRVNLIMQTGGTVYVVAPQNLQNEVFVSWLQKETGLRCLLGCDICRINHRVGFDDHTFPTLILWDCQGQNPENPFIVLQSGGIHNLDQNYLVLYNVPNALGIEERYVWQGVRGFFYETTPLTQFRKGIQVILDGQLWLSRDVTTRSILRKRPNDPEGMQKGIKDKPLLTPRERQILAQVAIGATNAEIAEKLFISAHTVKSHLYRIFKKIGVPNRVQAVLWAIKHF